MKKDPQPASTTAGVKETNPHSEGTHSDTYSQFHFWYGRLSPEEIVLIDNPRDVPLFRVLKGIPKGELSRLEKSFGAKRDWCLGDYNRHQFKWLEREQYSVSQRSHRDAKNSPELIEDMFGSGTPILYKIYFLFLEGGEVEFSNSFCEQDADRIRHLCDCVHKARQKAGIESVGAVA